MADYIDRDAAIEAMEELSDYDSAAKGIAAIYEIPAADVVERERGEWIEYQQGRWIYAKCAVCGTLQDVKSNFCPHCGCDMRKEETDG